ncbi:MAG: endonuclease [Prevotellaceae bacterium]|jgi:endonuclease/exonuclease/phosphatase family metal-dependent hydrolase|nr:endonuclease [Prevotellaceae bacterium]
MRFFAVILFLMPFSTGEVYSQVFKIMFYNVENFFDTENDPHTNDDNFTPQGENHWTRERFIKKRNNICKVTVAAGKGHMPDIIGLCEVENRYVLRQLVEETPLAKYEYDIVHYNSPDRRGIDAALLYCKKSFTVLTSKTYRIKELQTRDILYVKGYTAGNDTLHLFVNHWSSKWGGAESENSRMFAAKTLKNVVDSVFTTDINAKICIMGDFNDYPDSNPIKYLGAKAKNEGKGRLYNLSQHLQEDGQGSIKYQNRWELIDLFFVSESLMTGKKGLQCTFNDIEIFSPEFLMEKTTDGGFAPKRTYKGLRYAGGFSDHLPVILTFNVKN